MRRPITANIVRDIIIGGVFISSQIIAHTYITKVNGWITTFECGEVGDGILPRAAYANEFTRPINVMHNDSR